MTAIAHEHARPRERRADSASCSRAFSTCWRLSIGWRSRASRPISELAPDPAEFFCLHNRRCTHFRVILQLPGYDEQALRENSSMKFFPARDAE